MEKLKTYFENIGFTSDDLKKILNAFELRHFKKNEFLVEEWKTSKYIGFAETGMFQYYVIKNVEERTT